MKVIYLPTAASHVLLSAGMTGSEGSDGFLFPVPVRLGKSKLDPVESRSVPEVQNVLIKFNLIM